MTKYPDRFATESGEMPVEVRNAILEILYHALCCIRAFANHSDVCHEIADHTHNLPGLLQHQKPVLLANYCQAIPYFTRRMESLGQKVSIFEPAWRIIQQEYERVKTQPVA
ncbi:MAG: hypothetical protein QM813_27535 [Verrucomicrobiota bacterium]